MRQLGRRIAYALFLALIPAAFPWAARVRARLVNRMLVRQHRNLNIWSDVMIEGYRMLKLGDQVSISRGCQLICDGGLTIGDDVSIGPGTIILTTNHRFDLPGVAIKDQPLALAPTSIGSNVWIGANVTILAGVDIASGVVVAAGAVVSRSIDRDDVIVGGVPARIIKSRIYDPAKNDETT